MSVASWYFARNKSHVGSLTVVASVGKTFVFHIGTAAFGALIVAIVEVSFLGRGPGNRGAGSRHRSPRGLRAVPWLLSLLRCCLAAFGLTAPAACCFFPLLCRADDPSNPDVHSEEGEGVRQLGSTVPRVLLRVLLLVPRELHPLHQQKRIRAGVKTRTCCVILRSCLPPGRLRICRSTVNQAAPPPLRV